LWEDSKTAVFVLVHVSSPSQTPPLKNEILAKLKFKFPFFMEVREGGGVELF
jgi:hypothetical protein